MPNVGPGELVVLALLALLLFGPRKLPEVGRGIGDALREFKAALSGAPAQRPADSPPPTERDP